MKLRDLLAPLEAVDAGGDLDVEVSFVTRDSREAGLGVLFVAIAGASVDGHDRVADSAASAVIVQRRVACDLPWIRVSDTRRALAIAAAEVAGWPSRRVPIIGVTGTNGKTTTTTLIHQAVQATGGLAGRIGTTGVQVGDIPIPSTLTTPEAPLLQRWFAQMADAGASLVAMEVSSIGLVQHRVDATEFHVAAFTNLTQDHLDFHGTMATYASAKAELFRNHLRRAGGLPRALLNGDDPAWRLMDAPGDRWMFGFGEESCPNPDVRIERADLTASGMTVVLAHPFGRHTIASPLVGRHNASNLATAFAAGVLAGVDPDRMADGLRTATGAPGRLEVVPDAQGRLVVVDYAHSPDALEAVIASLRASCSGRLIVLFGCGGDRDRTKRPQMAAAARAGDVVIATTDNPRSEDPEAILADVVAGAPPGAIQVIVDREAAIRAAIAIARPGDAVLLAGKGHEDYQEIAGKKYPFDDRLVARAALEGR